MFLEIWATRGCGRYGIFGQKAQETHSFWTFPEPGALDERKLDMAATAVETPGVAQELPAGGAVSCSSFANQSSASARERPHISSDACKPPQQPGLSGEPKIRHRMSSSNWAQATLAGFPPGMPGIGLVMEGAMQQAPQFGRQFMCPYS